jgi:hypothetical protein
MEKWKLVTKASMWEITFKTVIHENLPVGRYMGTAKGTEVPECFRFTIWSNNIQPM